MSARSAVEKLVFPFSLLTEAPATWLRQLFWSYCIKHPVILESGCSFIQFQDDLFRQLGFPCRVLSLIVIGVKIHKQWLIPIFWLLTLQLLPSLFHYFLFFFFLLHFKTFPSCIGNLLADLGLVVGKACCKRYPRKTFDCWFGRKCLAALMALLELSALGFDFCARTFFRSVEVGVCCFKAEHQNRVVLCECLSRSSLCISVL